MSASCFPIKLYTNAQTSLAVRKLHNAYSTIKFSMLPPKFTSRPHGRTARTPRGPLTKPKKLLKFCSNESENPFHSSNNESCNNPEFRVRCQLHSETCIPIIITPSSLGGGGVLTIWVLSYPRIHQNNTLSQVVQSHRSGGLQTHPT
jgi:hypothetical protein